ncbi:hypothetical protein BDQ17DRAFT_1434015 [Cyathus striatus]|nr:hypothetical protein BDQ17DRAFT_1434015 [Cyathus striatus]
MKRTHSGPRQDSVWQTVVYVNVIYYGTEEGETKSTLVDVPDDSELGAPEDASDNRMHGRNGNPPEESQDVPTSMEENTNYTSSSPSSTDDIENNQPEPKPANEESYVEVLDMHGKHEETSDSNSDVHLSSRTSDKSASDTIEDVPSRILTESSGLFTNAHQFEIHGSSFADHSTRTQNMSPVRVEDFH